jgi:hypothetical protein
LSAASLRSAGVSTYEAGHTRDLTLATERRRQEQWFPEGGEVPLSSEVRHVDAVAEHVVTADSKNEDEYGQLVTPISS